MHIVLGVTALCLVLELPTGLLAGGIHAVLYVAVLAPLIIKRMLRITLRTVTFIAASR